MFFRNKQRKKIDSSKEKTFGFCSACHTSITSNKLSPVQFLCQDCFNKQCVYAGKCSENVCWTYEAGTLTISGKGDVLVFENSIDEARRTIYDPHNIGFAFDFPTFYESDIKDNTETIIVEDGIVSIIPKSLIVPFRKLKTIILAPSVVYIDESFTEWLSFKKEDKPAISVCGLSGSYAEVYASENNLAFSSDDA